MGKLFSVLAVIVPIFVVVALGVFARRRKAFTTEQIKGLQNFVTRFCLPCVLFNSCLSANMELEALTTMLCAIIMVFSGSVFSFWLKKRMFSYHNLPMMFCAQESGMLGIPLYLALFGAEHMFRMGVLDVAQSFVAIPIIALLSCDTGESASVPSIVKSVFQSPLLIASILGLFLNLTGLMQFFNEVGCGQILTQTTSFLAQPVSAAMLFSVGFNFSLDRENRHSIFRLSALRFAFFAAFGVIIIGILTITGSAISYTLWAVVLYTTLPASYLSPGFARSEEEAVVSSGVCSLLTMASLFIFCCVAVLTA